MGPGVQEKIGIINNINNGYAVSQERAEQTQNGIDIFVGYFNRLFAWCESLLKNWQLLIIGALACLIIWKRI